MRSLLTTVALAASTTLAHKQLTSTRKSLAFGPVHPHAKFDTEPPALLPSFAATSDDPKQIAQRFVDELVLPTDEERRHGYFIREDSYTDSTTGVTHVYFRQVVNGVEVADGNINVNVLNGKVISYGDSFFKGVRPPQGVDPASASALSREAHCEQLLSTVNEFAASESLQRDSEQVLFNTHRSAATSSQRVAQIYEHNCANELPSHLNGADQLVEPARAALAFMFAASPDSDLSEDIKSRFDHYLSQIESTTEHHLKGTSGTQYSAPIELLHNVPGTVGPVRARLAYVQTPEHDCHTNLALVWKLEVPMEDNWYEAAVSVSDASRIVEVLDWASDSSSEPSRIPGVYNVWKWGYNDPASGERSLEVSPYDEVASPLGWHSLPVANDPRSDYATSSKELVNETTTFGNNVFAHENWEGRSNWLYNKRPDGGKDLVFNYTYTVQDEHGNYTDFKSYIDLSVTQLFYTCNKIHDLYYRYGFDEAAGNFQQYNFGKGGKENDGVIANAQDGSGFNNANFMTPPDGQNGRMRMYVWNVHGYPYRDGDLEAGIVIHEYSHGLSTRLTGGPADSGCLGWGESGGMGEGWGDALATFIRSTEKYSDWPMGSWAANETRGIRNYPYSTNTTINPSTYHTLDKGGYWGVHAIGEVWAEILFVVETRLVEKYGFSASLFPPIPLADGTIPPDSDFYQPIKYDSKTGTPKRLVPKHGNSLIVQLIFDGMKLQPCRPGFFEARNAIIQADENLTGGENFCLLWHAFAERGLGVDATVQGRTPWGGGVRKDGFAVPKKCQTVPEEPAPEDPDHDKKKKHKHD